MTEKNRYPITDRASSIDRKMPACSNTHLDGVIDFASFVRLTSRLAASNALDNNAYKRIVRRGPTVRLLCREVFVGVTAGVATNVR